MNKIFKRVIAVALAVTLAAVVLPGMVGRAEKRYGIPGNAMNQTEGEIEYYLTLSTDTPQKGSVMTVEFASKYANHLGGYGDAYAHYGEDKDPVFIADFNFNTGEKTITIPLEEAKPGFEYIVLQLYVNLKVPGSNGQEIPAVLWPERIHWNPDGKVYGFTKSQEIKPEGAAQAPAATPAAPATPAPAVTAAPAPAVTAAPATSVSDEISATPKAGYKYMIKKGDNLSRIARKAYNDKKLYNIIFEANKSIIKNPSKIYPGQVIVIPAI